MKILVLQHSAADSPAAASDVIESLGEGVDTIRIDRGDAIPTTVEADVLMMFGGAISLAGDDLPPWVAPEQELIRQYVDQGRRVFGICLGSQMISSALGGSVRRNEEPEIGWHTVDRLPGSSKIVDEIFESETTVLQWHQDTFAIPPGASHLFRSAACENQGFVIDDRVFAFQFHLEADARTVEIFLAVSKKWQLSGPHVQSELEIRSGMERHLPSQQAILARFLRRWLSPTSSATT